MNSEINTKLNESSEALNFDEDSEPKKVGKGSEEILKENKNRKKKKKKKVTIR